MRLASEKSTWVSRGVCSVPGCTSGTLSDAASSVPGTTLPPTTQPCDAELPGQTA